MFKSDDVYEPSEETKKNAWVNNERIYEMASDYLTFWDSVARTILSGSSPTRRYWMTATPHSTGGLWAERST